MEGVTTSVEFCLIAVGSCIILGSGVFECVGEDLVVEDIAGCEAAFVDRHFR